LVMEIFLPGPARYYNSGFAFFSRVKGGDRLGKR
jgi:hypothetical protein